MITVMLYFATLFCTHVAMCLTSYLHAAKSECRSRDQVGWDNVSEPGVFFMFFFFLCLFSWASTEIKSSWIMPRKSTRTTWVLWSPSPWNNQRKARRPGRCRWKLTSTKPVFRGEPTGMSCCLVSQGNHVWNPWPGGERGETNTSQGLNQSPEIF